MIFVIQMENCVHNFNIFFQYNKDIDAYMRDSVVATGYGDSDPNKLNIGTRLLEINIEVYDQKLVYLNSSHNIPLMIICSKK